MSDAIASEPLRTDPGDPDDPSTNDVRPDDVVRNESAPVATPQPTGDVRVDDAVARLGVLDEVPTSEHADVFEDVHRRLHAALTELDTD